MWWNERKYQDILGNEPRSPTDLPIDAPPEDEEAPQMQHDARELELEERHIRDQDRRVSFEEHPEQYSAGSPWKVDLPDEDSKTSSP